MMNGSESRSFLSPVLIGRASQVEYLRRVFERDSRFETIVVSGEAGIGKSRLLTEVRLTAREAGFAVLQGHCFERDATFPFSALTDLLRSQLREWPVAEARPVLDPVAPELVKLVPELVALSPSLVPTPPLEAEQERRRLFHALMQSFLLAAQENPLLVVMEDLHWADETTLDFLVHCCRTLSSATRQKPIRLLLTYRTEDAPPPMRHMLADLDRLRLVEELRLEQLTRAETEVMVRAILGLNRPLRREFLDQLYALTEGNPFFVEELLKSIDGTNDADRQVFDTLEVPRTVADAVARRSELLSPAARRLMEVAAVTGQRFDLPRLQTMIGTDTGSLIEQVKELVARQLVVEEAAGRFRFRHALTRQAVYSGLLSTERASYHRALTTAIEAEAGAHPVDDDLRLVDLAYHSYEGGMWEKARRYCELAGLRAQQRFAPSVCVVHISHAIAADEHLGSSRDPSLLRVRASAYELLGEFQHAWSDLDMAIEAARQAHDREAEWEGLMALGSLWLSRDYDRAGSYFRDALSLARLLGDQRRIAHSLNRVGNWQMNLGDPPAALLQHNEALAIFEAVNDTEGMAATLDLLGMTSYHLVQPLRQMSYHREAVKLFRQLGNRQGAIAGLSVLAASSSSYEWPALPTDEAERSAAFAAGEEALGEAQAIEWRAGEAFACNTLSMAYGWTGNYDRAFYLAQDGLRIAREIDHEQWQACMLRALGELYLDVLNPERARAVLEEGLALARTIGSDFWTVSLSAALARAFVALGEVDAATSLLQPFLEERPVVLTAWHSGAAEVEVALARQDYGRALSLAGRLEAAAWPDGRPSRLMLSRIEALLSLKRTPEAAELSDRLLLTAAQVPPPMGWRSHLLRGRIQTLLGQRSEAAQSYRTARTIVDELAVAIPAPDLSAAFLSRARSMLPHSRLEAEARAQVREQFDGLTQREREVASLVALGRSNRQIAEALFLSERTVAVHVANILAKLSFASRSQIAAWATTRGLTSSQDLV